MYQYEKTLHLDDVSLLLGYLRGQAPDINQAIRAATGILSYGAGQLFPVSPFQVSAVAVSREQLVEYLEACVCTDASVRASLPWELILPMLLEVVKELLLRRRQGS